MKIFLSTLSLSFRNAPPSRLLRCKLSQMIISVYAVCVCALCLCTISDKYSDAQSTSIYIYIYSAYIYIYIYIYMHRPAHMLILQSCVGVLVGGI